tara:strand:+ start:654 stop:1106 length:453 start_codon:yes stop_codon:yes gene_type:complete
MTSILNKISFIVLAMFIAISTIGVSIGKVYCFHKKKNEYSISFDYINSNKAKCSCAEHQVEKKSSCCKAKKKPVKKKCCNSSSFRFVLDSDYEITSQYFSSQNSFSWIILALPILNKDCNADGFENENYNLRAPPLIVDDIPIMFQSFLI